MTTNWIGADTLSPGQQDALSAIADWFNNSDEQVFRMFGPAGTGKTTIARLVPGMVDAPAWFFGAFSGKAVNVLRTKGCEPAHTLHRLIYGAPISLRQELRKLEEQYDAMPPPETDKERLVLAEMRDRIKALRAKIKSEGSLRFDVNLESPLRDAAEAGGLLIADEVSMVGDKMAHDLLSFDCKVLVLGDPFQLPPVRGEGSFTRAEPDIMLHEVHRQALDSPVLQLATRIREGEFINYQSAAPRLRPWYQYDQILTWRRATRWDAVRALREREGRQPGMPEEGDRIMCLANNGDLAVFNGQSWVCVGVENGRSDDEVRLFLIDESDDPSDPSQVFETYSYLAAFNEDEERAAEEKRIGGSGDDTMLATFAQALTVHKAQGSEWGSVLVMDETRSMRDMEARRKGPVEADRIARRWMYTAVTRAAREVAVIPSKRG